MRLKEMMPLPGRGRGVAPVGRA